MDNQLKEACELLNIFRIDAEMALCGHWDKSDYGFECQIDIIDSFFNKVEYDYEEYEPEIEPEIGDYD
jgi:hypothetical protein